MSILLLNLKEAEKHFNFAAIAYANGTHWTRQDQNTLYGHISNLQDLASELEAQTDEPKAIIGDTYIIKCGWSDTQRARLEKVEQHIDTPKYGKGRKTVYFWRAMNGSDEQAFQFISYDLKDAKIA